MGKPLTVLGMEHLGVPARPRLHHWEILGFSLIPWGCSLPDLLSGEELNCKPHRSEIWFQKVHEDENALVNTAEMWRWEGFYICSESTCAEEQGALVSGDLTAKGVIIS